MKNIIYQFFRRPLVAIPVVGVIIFLATWGIDSRIINRLPPYSYAMVTQGSVPGTITLVGSVAPSEEIDIAFLKSGNVASVGAHTGQNIKAGTILASLSDQGTLGQLNQAKGAFEAAEANLASLKAGSTPQQLSLDKSAVTNTQTALLNAIQNGYVQVQDGINNKIIPFFGTVSTIQEPIILDSKYYNLMSPMTQALSSWDSEINAATPGDPQKLAQDTDNYLTTLISSVDSVSSDMNQQANTTIIPLATIQPLLAQITNVRLTLTNTKTTIDNAEAAYITAEGTLALAEAGPTTYNVAALQAQVDSAQGAYQAAQGTYDNNFIKAPINGTITFVNVEVGQNATPNQTVVGMVPTSAFQMVAYVDQDFLSRLPLGTQVNVNFTEIPGTTFSARVVDTESGSAVAQSNAQYKVTFELDGADSRIHTGLNASISLVGKDRENVLVIPRSALLMQNGSYFVLVKKGGSLVQTPINVGLVSTEKVEVTSGIVEGDTVALIGV